MTILSTAIPYIIRRVPAGLILGRIVIKAVCNPILVTTFPEWFSGTKPWPHTSSVLVMFVMCFRAHLQYSFAGLIRRRHRQHSVTLQSPTATLILLFSSSEHTGCGYPGLFDRKKNTLGHVSPIRTLDSLRPGAPLLIAAIVIMTQARLCHVNNCYF